MEGAAEFSYPRSRNSGRPGNDYPFLFTLACINLLTKEVATISGILFTLTFFATFAISEKLNRRRHEAATTSRGEHFQLEQSEEVSQGTVNVRVGNVLVACRNPHHLEHFQKVLDKTDTRKVDIVVLSVHRVTAAASGEFDLEPDQIFASVEQELFSKVVAMAETSGKKANLLAVAAANPWTGIVQTAAKLGSARVVTGLSPHFADNPFEQGKVVGEAWEALPAPRPSLTLEVVLPDHTKSLFFNLGPHPPRLWPEDVELVHELWLELIGKGLGSKLHHRDVVGVALRRLREQLHSPEERTIIDDLAAEMLHHPFPDSMPALKEDSEDKNE